MTFTLFEPAHLWAMLTIASVSILLPLAMRQIKGGLLEKNVPRVIAGALIAHEAFKFWIRAYVLDHPLNEQLPLHLCGVAAFLTAFTLWRKSYPLYEIVYFWGLAGGMQAILTPDLQRSFPSLPFFAFFIGHGLIIVGVMYTTLVYRFRPTFHSVIKTMKVTLLYMVLIAPTNYILGTNYLYLRAKPTQPSLLDYLGPWPWYIPSLIVVGIIICFIYYAPFAIIDWLSRRKSRQ